ncbi:MAG: polyphosphate kinase 2 family protein, partial [Gammaproteobacteria bacterium]|nr:polyphosphate kinase 2 family protein [Gammaproteobacteria bacterium]
DAPGKQARREILAERVAELDRLQRIFYAHDRHSMLLVFQGMDAAGKDSTIRSILQGVNPAGCQVFSFKQPSAEELDHDFLWRSSRRLPERGRIGIFNRSYYEEVLVVRVHPEYLGGQQLPAYVDTDTIWQSRYESIREHEKHLAANGTVILKFWLNVSRDAQRQRFLDRLNEPEKNWKFSTGDMRERGFWDDYMQAFEDAVRETSRPWAPWYAIPADSKSYMRMAVADIVVRAMQSLDMHYPEVHEDERRHFEELRKQLEEEGS